MGNVAFQSRLYRSVCGLLTRGAVRRVDAPVQELDAGAVPGIRERRQVGPDPEHGVELEHVREDVSTGGQVLARSDVDVPVLDERAGLEVRAGLGEQGALAPGVGPGVVGVDPACVLRADVMTELAAHRPDLSRARRRPGGSEAPASRRAAASRDRRVEVEESVIARHRCGPLRNRRVVQAATDDGGATRRDRTRHGGARCEAVEVHVVVRPRRSRHRGCRR